MKKTMALTLTILRKINALFRERRFFFEAGSSSKQGVLLRSKEVLLRSKEVSMLLGKKTAQEWFKKI